MVDWFLVAGYHTTSPCQQEMLDLCQLDREERGGGGKRGGWGGLCAALAIPGWQITSPSKGVWAACLALPLAAT